VMKKILFSICCIGMMAFTSCNGNSNGYTVKGTVEGAVDGDTVFLSLAQAFFGTVPIDTAIVKDGKFEFSGSYEGVDICFAVPMHKGEPIGKATFILENAPIELQIKNDQKKSVVKGGESQKLLDEHDKGIEAINPGNALEVANDSSATDEQRKEAQAKIVKVMAQQRDFTVNFIKTHASTKVGDMLFGYCADNLTPEQVDAIMAEMEKVGANGPYLRKVKELREADKATAVGQTFTDFEQNDLTGKPVKASDIVKKNKFTLIDFWASWCGPCIAEMPAMKKAYSDFHAKGFEVLGVSLDQEADVWKATVARLKLPWPQVSDLKGWDNAAAKLYSIQSLPFNVLVDQNGKINTKNVRDEDLYNKVAELLK